MLFTIAPPLWLLFVGCTYTATMPILVVGCICYRHSPRVGDLLSLFTMIGDFHELLLLSFVSYCCFTLRPRGCVLIAVTLDPVTHTDQAEGT